MSADPIQAAKERLTERAARDKLWDASAQEDAKAVETLLAELSRLEGEVASKDKELGETIDEAVEVVRRLKASEAALADGRREIAERDEALKALADEIEHEGLRIGIRSLSQTGPHDDEGLGYSDGLKACAKMIRRALLSTEPAGGGEKVGIMAHMPSPERLREQIAGDPDVDVEAGEPPQRLDMQARRMTRCQADSDGDCEWSGCPQLRDNEPKATGRHCPLDQDDGGGDA